MYLLKKVLFILLFISLFSINDVAFGQEAANEYILATDHIEELTRELPMIIKDEIPAKNIYRVLLQEPAGKVLTELEHDSRVISISPNYTITVPPIMDLPYPFFGTLSLDTDWGFRSMNFPQKIPSITDIDVAILDTGIDTDHPLLKNSIKDGYDALFDTSIEDENGHGTHVAGIIAMNTPQLNIIPIKSLDKDGSGNLYAFLRGLHYAIDHKADVINMSFGMKYNNQMIQDAVNEAISNGISVVAASGNYGSPSLQYPAAYEDVISVGAYDQNGIKANFSQYGDQLDFVAPGVDIWSTWLMGEYKLHSGTSMATPFITKTVALLKSINPHLGPTEIEEILITASSPLKGETVEKVGHGKVDVEVALKLAESKQNSYEYFPSKFNVSSVKDWQIKMSLPLDAVKFDPSFIRVVDIEGKEAKTSIHLDEADQSIIHVSSPLNGYTTGSEYELIVEKGLVSASGKTLLQGAIMKFTVIE